MAAKKKKTLTEAQVKFVLRLDPKQHSKVKRSAKANNTSMNKEISNIIAANYSGRSVDKKLDEILLLLTRSK